MRTEVLLFGVAIYFAITLRLYESAIPFVLGTLIGGFGVLFLEGVVLGVSCVPFFESLGRYCYNNQSTIITIFTTLVGEYTKKKINVINFSDILFKPFPPVGEEIKRCNLSKDETKPSPPVPPRDEIKPVPPKDQPSQDEMLSDEEDFRDESPLIAKEWEEEQKRARIRTIKNGVRKYDKLKWKHGEDLAKAEIGASLGKLCKGLTKKDFSHIPVSDFEILQTIVDIPE